MTRMEKLLRALALKQELETLQTEFRKTVDEPSSDAKLAKLMEIDAIMRHVTIEVMKLIQSGSKDDEDNGLDDDFKIER